MTLLERAAKAAYTEMDRRSRAHSYPEPPWDSVREDWIACVKAAFREAQLDENMDRDLYFACPCGCSINLTRNPEAKCCFGCGRAIGLIVSNEDAILVGFGVAPEADTPLDIQPTITEVEAKAWIKEQRIAWSERYKPFGTTHPDRLNISKDLYAALQSYVRSRAAVLGEDTRNLDGQLFFRGVPIVVVDDVQADTPLEVEAKPSTAQGAQ